MEIELGTLINNKYLVVSKATYDGILYIFANEVINSDEIGNNNYIFKVENNTFVMVEDEELKNILLSIFEKKLNKMLEEGD